MADIIKKLRSLLGVILYILLGIIAIAVIVFLTGASDILGIDRDTGEVILFCTIVVIPIYFTAYYFYKNSKFSISRKADDKAAFLKEKAYNEIKKKHNL